MSKTPAQRLTQRAMKRESEIIDDFVRTAKSTGMTPATLAAITVLVCADLNCGAVRSFCRALQGTGDLPNKGRVFFAVERVRLQQIWKDRDFFPNESKESQHRFDMMRSPPAFGYFWLLCVAEAPGLRMLSWSASLIAWSIAGAAQEGASQVTREEALALWDSLITIDPTFFDTFPYNKTGPLTDDERIEIIQYLAPHIMKESSS